MQLGKGGGLYYSMYTLLATTLSVEERNYLQKYLLLNINSFFRRQSNGLQFSIIWKPFLSTPIFFRTLNSGVGMVLILHGSSRFASVMEIIFRKKNTCRCYQIPLTDKITRFSPHMCIVHCATCSELPSDINTMELRSS